MKKILLLFFAFLMLCNVTYSQNFTLVVIGSSTAGGSGASKPDSAWVARFRKSIALIDPLSSVINIARGFQTTYSVLPDDFINKSAYGINSDNNISKAISFKPDAIIVNLPSNDAQSGFSVHEQLRNYFILDSVAKQNNIPIWFVSTQPRNLTNEVTRQRQLEVKDSLLVLYKDFLIDVYTELSDSNDFILKKYDSGDGIHLNNKGHNVIFEQVINSSLYRYIKEFYLVRIEAKIEGEIQCYPNPFRDIVTIELPSDLVFPVDLSIYNVQSNSFEIKVVLESRSDLKIKTPLEKLSKGAYLLKIANSNMEYNTKLVKLD
jgi:lysophospholipase L1-like esterase